MKQATALFAVFALLVAAGPVLASSETNTEDNGSSVTTSGQTSGQTSDQQAEVQPPAQKPPRQGAAVASDAVESQSPAAPRQEPGRDDNSPGPVPEPRTPVEYSASDYRPDPGPPGGGPGDHGGRGGRGRRGGWRPPSHPPHGRRGQWRRDRYHFFGSWHFLIFGGPIVWCPPRSSHVVRLPRRSGIYVRQTGDDEIGRAFATSVRERLREQRLKVVSSEVDAALELYIVSMEDDPEDPGWGSAVSVSYVSHPGQHFITAQMLDVGDEQVDELAEYVAEYVDELADDYCR